MRKLNWSWLWIGALGLGASPVASCTPLPDNCDNHRTCDTAGTAGSSSGAGNDAGAPGESGAGTTGGSGGKGGAGASGSSSGGKSGTAGSAGSLGSGGEGGGGACDTTKSPSEDSCIVSDEFAVFVSPSGMDDNDGTQGAPLATLTKAVEVAAGQKVVLVCDATYNEQVSITGGGRIYGGFKCANWSAEAGKPLFKPTTGTALRIDTVADDVVIESVGFEVGDALAAGETALTALVNDSPKVTFRAVSLKAGAGKNGANGTPTPFTFPDRSELDGNNASGLTGGPAKVCTCPGGAQTSGGGGGNGQVGGQGGGVGTPALGGGAAGTAGQACNSGGGGGDGGAAKAISPAAGASILGTASGNGWLPKEGADGLVGGPGQGGGGGAASATGGGGSGGCGTCGGAGGKRGQGGGASIALLVLDSGLSLTGCELVASDSGNGGGGVAGQAARTEAGFAGIQGTGACPGGKGGLGAAGGAGGGGAGGISVGIVWKGAMPPTVSADTTITNGKAGAKGAGGAAGNDGIAGVAQKILPLN